MTKTRGYPEAGGRGISFETSSEGVRSSQGSDPKQGFFRTRKIIVVVVVVIIIIVMIVVKVIIVIVVIVIKGDPP